jgi:hypothetical protein
VKGARMHGIAPRSAKPAHGKTIKMSAKPYYQDAITARRSSKNCCLVDGARMHSIAHQGAKARLGRNTKRIADQSKKRSLLRKRNRL